MSLSDPIITDVRLVDLGTHYPRTVGRNARLGSQGSGPMATAAVITTDSGAVGWGLIEGRSGGNDSIIGRSLTELIDPADGVRDESSRWLDIALHDLLGVVADRPVWDLLGGAGPTTVPVYSGAVYFDDLDPDDAPRGPAAVLENCRADADLGYRDFKLKIGRGNRWMARAEGDARDVAVTRAVREAWPDARILVDANDGYDVAGFCRYLDAVGDVGLYWVEEPFPDDGDDLARLRRHRDLVSPSTLIADGEARPDTDLLLGIAADGGLDVLLMDVMSFGLTAWRRLMPQVAATGVKASPHAWGQPLKTLYAAQLAAGLGRIEIVEGVPGRTDGVDMSAYTFAGGLLTVPDRPGFGLPVPARVEL
ncbi:mandelate racemase/muconate lactonizing enzyme family protein [Microlunatus sp. Gsoil 973]|uniref:mandelate racemase/muconate lactonizing enzyme family protein n=1 Tax=Microlunatus sp. Gsoil 973 TaxID=2672569 RepID=UPI0012B4D91F|nr:enolase C-terminal domain-like protein [Microlunatus sp. Gsoil 973]QGN34063.1 mandelate racemase [Microlunatus sp. Gsoil 973]